MKYKELIEAHGLTLHGDIEHFAALVEAEVRADEREACAKVCEKSDRYRGDYFAAVIRARGTT